VGTAIVFWNCIGVLQPSPWPDRSTACTFQYRWAEAGKFVPVNEVDVVVTGVSPTSVPKPASEDTHSVYRRAPATGVHWNVGWLLTVAPSAGATPVGGIEWKANACG